MKPLNSLREKLDGWVEKNGTANIKPASGLKFGHPPRSGRQIVAGGDIRWKPIDKTAAMLFAKAHWLSAPPQQVTVKIESLSAKQKQTKQTKQTKTMNNSKITTPEHQPFSAGSRIETADSGVRVKVVNGETFLNLDDVQSVIATEIAKLPRETRPNVKAAEDAREIIHQLMLGLGGDMEQFRANSKIYLDDVRNVRFAFVTETAQMTSQLKDIRQFFLGSDYKDQISRLKEFVDLCERLNNLKQSGFLDTVADTMLRLSA